MGDPCGGSAVGVVDRALLKNFIEHGLNECNEYERIRFDPFNSFNPCSMNFCMKEYFKLKEKIINDFSEKNITSLYDEGYVFTRLGKGVMDQTRSVRIDLKSFELSSENRRILHKTEELKFDIAHLSHFAYHWSIGKLAKDFYDTKFGKGTFSANKMKELMTSDQTSFNTVLIFQYQTDEETKTFYAICYENTDILHYSYPFYDLNIVNKDIGMGMMTRAVSYAKDIEKKYIYLGSAQRPTDTYKLQFEGVEWFDGKKWETDLIKLKDLLRVT